MRITKREQELAAYVYQKKALPGELVDNHFRQISTGIDHDKLLQFSEQITELGKQLCSPNQEILIPDTPLLDIQEGKMSVQRLIYRNFLKCFWSEEMGYENSVMTNYDWYGPSLAFVFSIDEFQ